MPHDTSGRATESERENFVGVQYSTFGLDRITRIVLHNDRVAARSAYGHAVAIELDTHPLLSTWPIGHKFCKVFCGCRRCREWNEYVGRTMKNNWIERWHSDGGGSGDNNENDWMSWSVSIMRFKLFGEIQYSSFQSHLLYFTLSAKTVCVSYPMSSRCSLVRLSRCLWIKGVGFT